MTDSELTHALSRNLFGFAVLDCALTIVARQGALMDWLPDIGATVCQSTVFFAMEAEFTALRAGEIEQIDMPNLRVKPHDDAPFSVSTTYNRATDAFLVFASADCGAQEMEMQLARERRELRRMEDQAKTASRLVREKEALYRDIVETASELVLRLGTDLCVTFVNPHACRLLDATEPQILGRAIDALLGASAPDEQWGQRLRADGVASFEQPLRRSNGPTIWIWWSVRWLGANGGPGEYQAVGRDMTAQRRLRLEASRGAEEAKHNAVMRERLRIAHDLHDTLVHSLVALVPQIRLIRKVAGEGADPRLLDELARAEAAARDGLARARAALADLRRQNVEPDGLGAALERLARRFSERTGVNVRVDIDPSARQSSGEMAEALFRIADEALRNAELHAEPHSVSVTLASDDAETLTLVIADDGRGFDPEQVKFGHFGLIGMLEQAELIGARLSLDSHCNLGTRVTIVSPRQG